MNELLELLLEISAILSLLAFMGLFAYASLKFFRIFRKFHEESLFHLSILSVGMTGYFFIIIIMIVWIEDTQTIIFIIERLIGVVYSILSLEMSLFYITTFTYRRSLWEKYVPFLFGITTGISFSILVIAEDNPFLPLLLCIAYILPLILIAVLVARICIRTFFILQETELKMEDRSFLKALAASSIFLFLGAIGDLTFFLIMLVTEVDIWAIVVSLSGIITPILLILSIIFVRKIFSNIEEADVVHLMNLLS